MLTDRRKNTAVMRSITHLPPNSGNICAMACRFTRRHMGPRLNLQATFTSRPATCCPSGESMQTRKVWKGHTSTLLSDIFWGLCYTSECVRKVI